MTMMNNGAVELSENSEKAPIDEKALIQKWQGEINSAKMDRMPFEREWYQNIAFMSGRQWLQWDAAATSNYMGALIEKKAPEGRVRITVNLTRRLVNKQHAKLGKEQIRGFISPTTSDDEDIAAARAGERLNSYLIDVTKLSDRLNRVDWWMLVCGTAFTKDWYNDKIMVPGPEEEVQDEMTGEIRKEATKLYGLPVVETIDPFHLYVENLDEPDIDNQAWVCHVAVKTAAQIRHQWNVEVAEGETLSANSVESKLNAAQGMRSTAKKKGVEVKELWVKPCAEYEEGMVLIWAGDKVLAHEPAWPYNHGDYPFTRRQWVETGRFYGESTITDLRPLQVEYNKTRSQIIEDKNRMARPMMAYQIGSIDPGKMRGRAGEMVGYKPGTPAPTPIPMPNVPNYVIEHVRHLQDEMAKIAEQGSLEESIPSGVTAATAISFIQESQDAVLSETLRDKERAYERICRHLLSYAVQYWDAQRQIKVVGENQNFETFLLAASDLRGNTDWKVVTGSATPQSRSAKQATIMELMKMGVLPADRSLQFLEMGDVSKLYEEMQVDVREAERQNLKMSKGIPSETGDWQNLLVHVTTHDNYRKREEYDNLGDDIKRVFRHHVFMDMMLLAKQMGMQMDPMQQQMLGQQTQMDPLYVDQFMEEALRGFVLQLQSGSSGGQPPPTGNTA